MTHAAGDCPFCHLPDGRIVASSRHGVVVRDAFPVSPGHTLVIPRRHADSFFSLSDEERQDLLTLVVQAQTELNALHHPDSYNIGINDGPAAGRTVPHLHIHLIPRYRGDVADPRGGVRWVIADKADYWSKRS